MMNRYLLATLAFLALIGTALLTHEAYKLLKGDVARQFTPLSAQIVGPATVAGPGDDAIYHVITPGHDARDLIFSLAMKPDVHGQTQLSTAGLAPGYFSASTRPGDWTIHVSATDPKTREAVMCSFSLHVPKSKEDRAKDETPEKPKPFTPPPAPNVTPDTPDPPPPVVTRFSDLTTKVRTLIAGVTSPNKSTEATAMAAGARAIAQQCLTGDLSRKAGWELELAVVREIQKANSSAIGPNAAAWKSFALEVSTFLSTAITNKQITSPRDYADALNAFAAGLS